MVDGIRFRQTRGWQIARRRPVIWIKTPRTADLGLSASMAGPEGGCPGRVGRPVGPPAA